MCPKNAANTIRSSAVLPLKKLKSTLMLLWVRWFMLCVAQKYTLTSTEGEREQEREREKEGGRERERERGIQ